MRIVTAIIFVVLTVILVVQYVGAALIFGVEVSLLVDGNPSKSLVLVAGQWRLLKERRLPHKLYSESSMIPLSPIEAKKLYAIMLREDEKILKLYQTGAVTVEEKLSESNVLKPDAVTDHHPRRFLLSKKKAGASPKPIDTKMKEKEEAEWMALYMASKHKLSLDSSFPIWKGIPDKFRIAFWQLFLGIDKMPSSKKIDFYHKLLLEQNLLLSNDIQPIHADIQGTLKNSKKVFRQRYGTMQKKLFNVLLAYSIYNPQIGYHKGMCKIAALLLLNMGEEEAFWSLHALMVDPKYDMEKFFTPMSTKLNTYKLNWKKIMKKYLPDLQAHLDDIGFPSVDIKQWWLNCFYDSIPFSLAIRVWDAFLYYGDSIIIAMTFNIMKMHKAQMMKLNFDDILDFMKNKLPGDFGYTDDQVMKSLKSCYEQLYADKMLPPPSPPNPKDPSEILSVRLPTLYQPQFYRTQDSSFVFLGNDDILQQIVRQSDNINVEKLDVIQKIISSADQRNPITLYLAGSNGKFYNMSSTEGNRLPEKLVKEISAPFVHHDIDIKSGLIARLIGQLFGDGSKEKPISQKVLEDKLKNLFDEVYNTILLEHNRYPRNSFGYIVQPVKDNSHMELNDVDYVEMRPWGTH